MRFDPDTKIRTTLEEIMDLARSGQADAAAVGIEVLEREYLAELETPAGVDTINLVDPAVSLRMYVKLAHKDLEAGDAGGAIVSLERALGIVKKKAGSDD